MIINQIQKDTFIKINVEIFGIVDIRQKAWFTKPPEHFENSLNIKFEDDVDDLDFLKRAFFSIGNKIFFVLSRYKNVPNPNSTVLEMPKDLTNEDVNFVLKELEKECGLLPNEIMKLE